jgi:hypothetical protein
VTEQFPHSAARDAAGAESPGPGPAVRVATPPPHPDDNRVDDRSTWLAPLIALGVLAFGSIAAWHYSSLGLALAHWDARAHLVVARRILDSLMPGWQQIGAVWLPLPHVLNMIPVQVDAWYRTGASGIAISVLSMAAGAWALAALLHRTTGSRSAALAGGALVMLNPNVLYLQSTPMTEAVLFGTMLVSVALTARWVDDGGGPARIPGLALAAACMTRYEAWPISVALIGLAAVALLRRGAPLRAAVQSAGRLALYPALAIALFMVNSRWTVGSWFVSGGFFVAENEALGRIGLAWEQVRDGVLRLSGRATVWPAYAGIGVLLFEFARSRRRASLILVLALLAAAALPLYAYVQGHPVRIRYSVVLVVACSAIASAGIAVLHRRLRPLAAAGLVAAVLLQSLPFDRSAPLIVEAQRDARNVRGRETVTRYLEQHYDARLIMMSMGSLAHYMHDLSRSGFSLREFLHEGNGELWVFALLLGPRGYVGWVIIEEQAEGGDVLSLRSRARRSFLDGFERVAEGGGVALYREVSVQGSRVHGFTGSEP